MTYEEIKEKIKSWINESKTQMTYTIGDLMMFAFNGEVVSGQEVSKAIFSLANEGFLCYVESHIKNPMTNGMIPCFRKHN